MKTDINKVPIKKHQQVDIFFDCERVLFFGSHPKTKESFQGKYLFEIIDHINDSYWEEYDEEGFVKTWSGLNKVHATRRNKKTKQINAVITDSIGSKYDVGKVISPDTTIYPTTPDNLAIYEEVSELEDEINSLKLSQRELIGRIL